MDERLHELPPQDPNFNPEIFEKISTVNGDNEVDKIFNEMLDNFLYLIDRYIPRYEDYKILEYLGSIKEGLNLIIKVLNSCIEISENFEKEKLGYRFKQAFNENNISFGDSYKEIFENLTKLLNYNKKFELKWEDIENLEKYRDIEDLEFKLKIVKISEEEIKNYYNKIIKNMKVIDVINEITEAMEFVNIFINKTNRDKLKLLEYLENPKKLKNILVKSIFFSNFVYENSVLFLENIPKLLFSQLVNTSDIDKIKNTESVIKEIIEFQFKYFLIDLRESYFYKSKLLSIYIVYFLLLRAIKNEKEDFVKFYHYWLEDMYYEDNSIFYVISYLLGKVHEKIYNLEKGKMLDFSQINLSDEDILFSMSFHCDDILSDINRAFWTCIEMIEKLTGEKPETNDNMINQFKLLYIKHVDDYVNDLHRAIDEFLSKEFENRWLRVLLKIEEYERKEIEVPMLPIKKEEKETVKL